ncbi:hypothetical protein RRG08_036573 [Elysia crispata]|uniref:Uncharacterized protein n=1 Tax=Elysia crispata TaxID=231223 RepID=A0AAE0ZRB1_9GAST|nr:hypothetical protein RRG08_036573 [Elysia crispata]
MYFYGYTYDIPYTTFLLSEAPIIKTDDHLLVRMSDASHHGNADCSGVFGGRPCSEQQAIQHGRHFTSAVMRSKLRKRRCHVSLALCPADER